MSGGDSIPAPDGDRPDPPSSFDRKLARASRFGVIILVVLALIVALQVGQVIFAPVVLAIIIGLVLGPVAARLERAGFNRGLSAAITLLLFIAIIAGSLLIFALPLSEWVARWPVMWRKLQVELTSLRQPLEALAAIRDQLKALTGGGDAIAVSVDDAGATELALLVPHVLTQVLVFLASLYFYMATRRQIQRALLGLITESRLRWRIAHLFLHTETKVSRFLLIVTALNLGVGAALALACWVLGLPSPLLWGALAFVLNFVPYVGQAAMMAILLMVSLGTQTGLVAIALPLLAYLAITVLEGQLITPQVIGHTMTINPLAIFLAITLGLWLWGPIGGLISVPLVTIIQTIVEHVAPNRLKAQHQLARRLSAAKPVAPPADA